MSREGSAATPELTWALIAVNTVVFGAMAFSGGRVDNWKVEHLLRWGASVGYLVVAGQWWRLLSSMFLHASIAR